MFTHVFTNTLLYLNLTHLIIEPKHELELGSLTKNKYKQILLKLKL